MLATLQKRIRRDDAGRTWWTFRIDREIFSDYVVPFSASDHEFICTCRDNGEPSALPEIHVRRADDSVIWMCYSLDTYILNRTIWPPPTLPYPGFVVFDAATYESIIQRGSARDLPNVSDVELRNLLRLVTIPDADLALYREPESVGDLNGRGLLRAARLWRDEDVDAIRRVEAVRNIQTVDIGLDDADASTARWQVGECPDGPCLRFITQPELRVWMTSPRLRDHFANWMG